MGHHCLPTPHFRYILFVLIISSLGAGPGPHALAQDRFRPDRDHAIDLGTATLYTTSLQRAGNSAFVRAVAFGRDAVLELLNQPGCAGIRVYQGMEEHGRRVLVLVGVDLEGKDLYLGRLEDKGWPCPPVCDDSSPLNGN
jgi:hypothetical protein